MTYRRMVNGKILEVDACAALLSDFDKGREFTRRGRVNRVALFTSWSYEQRPSVAYDIEALFGSQLTTEDTAL